MSIGTDMIWPLLTVQSGGERKNVVINPEQVVAIWQLDEDPDADVPQVTVTLTTGTVLRVYEDWDTVLESLNPADPWRRMGAA